MLFTESLLIYHARSSSLLPSRIGSLDSMLIFLLTVGKHFCCITIQHEKVMNRRLLLGGLIAIVRRQFRCISERKLARGSDTYNDCLVSP